MSGALDTDTDDLQDLEAPAAVPIQPGFGDIAGANAGNLTGVAGGTMSALSAIEAGNASARLMRANAAIAGAQAVSESQAGAQQAELYRQKLNQTLGRQAAQVGGANITMSGSALKSVENTAQLGQEDINQIGLNAARRAWGFRVQQAGDQFQAKEDSAAGWQKGLGSLVTTGARAYGNWSTDY